MRESEKTVPNWPYFEHDLEGVRLELELNHALPLFYYSWKYEMWDPTEENNYYATYECPGKYCMIQLEALRERRPPWPRQIITPILSTVKMLSLGCERLPTPLKKKKKKKVLDHYLQHDLGMLPLLRCFFAHLLILQYPDHHQNLISSYLYYSGPVHKISSQSVHNFLSNVVHRQTDRQTDRQTNATKNITSFAKEVITWTAICMLVLSTVDSLIFLTL